MLELTLVAAVAAAAGFLWWGLDRHHRSYGVLLVPGIAVAAAVLLWIILVMSGLASQPRIFWLSWLIPMVAGAAAAAIAGLFLGRRRSRADVARLNAALRL
jgi:lipopolysaccharide export LptBFGC system permease protein LptF